MDQPVIQYVVEEAVEAGITDILMIIGRGKRAIEEHFDRNFELEAGLAGEGPYRGTRQPAPDFEPRRHPLRLAEGAGRVGRRRESRAPPRWQ